MVTKDKEKNKAYVRKSRQKLINTIGIDAYRKRNADAQREYRKNKKPLKMLILAIENFAHLI